MTLQLFRSVTSSCSGDDISQYKETCEILLDDTKIGGEDIKYNNNKEITGLLNENINFHSSRLISKFSENGVKCISKLQWHCANMTFSKKIRYDRIFQKATQKWGDSEIICIKIF